MCPIQKVRLILFYVVYKMIHEVTLWVHGSTIQFKAKVKAKVKAKAKVKVKAKVKAKDVSNYFIALTL